MAIKYAFSDYSKELMARAVGRDLSISKKQSVEICKWIRHKPLIRAKKMLEEVIAMKTAVPYTRFNWNVGHRPGMGPGRYPITCSAQILAILKSAEANAQAKGLNTGNLVIVHCNAQKAPTPLHYGRQRGTHMKRTHIEIVLQEKAEKKTEEKAKSKAQKEKKTEKKDKQGE
ncbi:50S ribosomal protein L22 [Candidatus Woesearchaeota archaeon]|nr:50S ribosomal protein L22 [Candidatus Woesearchaeota archaeon]